MNNSKKSAGEWLELSAPAKINLMLSVHGRREDGFHELTSLIAAVEFGDDLKLRINEGEQDKLVSDGEGVPLDDSNLVLQAARLFREVSGRPENFDFILNKRIPVGAGMGGGSSDAVAALKGMNVLLDAGMSHEKLMELAASLGSDCPFFVDAAPAIMRGRGEVIEPVDQSVASRLAGQRLVLFRPEFAINTAWAYGRLASMPTLYEPEARAGERLHAFYRGGDLDELLHNGFEAAVGEKFLAIPSLLEILRGRDYRCMMSGSGSACFALLDNDQQATDILEVCRECWGEEMFWVETSLSDQKMR